MRRSTAHEIENTYNNRLQLASTAVTDPLERRRDSDLRRARAITTVHEILHFSFGEGALARAVAAMKGEEVPKGGGLLGASRYWGSELIKHCR